MDSQIPLSKILYGTGFGLIVLGGAFIGFWNMNTLGFIIAIAGVITAGFGKILEG